jgi:hypothetical protein
MATYNEQAVAHLNRAAKKEQSVYDDTIRTLHHQGLTITQSIKVLMSNYQMSLREAKSLVSDHPVWNSVTEAAEPLHKEIVRILKNAKKEHSGETKSVFRFQSPIENAFFMNNLTLNLAPLAITEEQFAQVCHVNPDLRLELTTRGELIIVPSPDKRRMGSELTLQPS